MDVINYSTRATLYFIDKWMFTFMAASGLITALKIKNEVGSVQENKLRCLILMIRAMFGGGIIANLAIGIYPIQELHNSTALLIIFIIWILMIYSTFIENLLESRYSRVVFHTFADIWCCRNILIGITKLKILRSFNWTAILISTLIGLLHGDGINLLRNKYEVAKSTKMYFVVSAMLSIIFYVNDVHYPIAFLIILTLKLATTVSIVLEVLQENEETYEKAVEILTTGAIISLTLAIIADAPQYVVYVYQEYF